MRGNGGTDRKTTITVHKKTLDRLASLKVHPNQSLEEVLTNLLDQLKGPPKEEGTA